MKRKILHKSRKRYKSPPYTFHMHINAIRFLDRKVGIPICRFLQFVKWAKRKKFDAKKLDVKKILIIKHIKDITAGHGYFSRMMISPSSGT